MNTRESSSDNQGRIFSVSVSPQKKSTKRPWVARRIWDPPIDLELGLDTDSSLYEQAFEAEVYDAPQPHHVVGQSPKKKQRTLRTLRLHQHWRKEYQQIFLDELLRHEGRGAASLQSACWDCLKARREQKGQAEFRCLDCLTIDMLCQGCMVRRHHSLPLHRVQRWTGSLFRCCSLKDIGLVIQLDHQTKCPSPQKCNSKLRILDATGVHDTNLLFCGCPDANPHYIQLLRRGLYPSTLGQGKIRTVATFRYLEQLHLLTLTTKGSVYNFYRAISKTTDNTTLKLVPWRYTALMRMCLQWRHLKLLKRMGRGHEASGVAGTKEGDLVVPCMSCPHPGINLPEGWEDDAERRDEYSLMVTQDANFRLKEQLVSSHSRDLGLVNGLGYFVGASEADISTCAGFQAIAKATTKFSKGLRYTGVGSVLCARSEMFLENGVGNLQKGERYGNMDYVFASALYHFMGLLLCIVGYDIACQWFHCIGTSYWEVSRTSTRDDDHEQFLANLVSGVGLTDFEGCERAWSVHNPLGNATKTMAPGTRADTLEAHFGFHNWQKYTSTETTKDRNRQCEAHEGLTESIPKDLVDEWECICETWENAPYPKKKAQDGSALVNPFAVRREFLTKAQVELELAMEDEIMAQKGIPLRNRTRPGKFILMGLDLEESQYKLGVELEQCKKATKTALQTSQILERRNILKRTLRAFEKLRSVYMPGLVQYLTNIDEDLSYNEDGHPKNEKLWLPSTIPTHLRKQVCCDDVDTIEERLRRARAYDALDSVRHTLRVKTKMILFKNKNVRLRGDWEEELRVMGNDDVRSYADPERKKQGPGRQGTNEEEPGMEGIPVEEEVRPVQQDNEDEISLLAQTRSRRDRTGETRKQQSWIWVTRRINLKDGADENDNEVLRAEWCRSRARLHRAEEELRYLQVEMERLLLFLEWRSKWWEQRQQRPNPRKVPRLEEGVKAYAMRQAEIQQGFHAKFLKMWSVSLRKEEGVEGGEETLDRAAREELGLAGREDDDEEDEEALCTGNEGGDAEIADRMEEEGEAEADEAEYFGFA
ncbi:hypothetical protein BT96DRAFT_991729 [Gymnopus androsaceus JB14]|uniref:CxC2-like cysteine cluster KDZ transposase-associated domain-containing protein n=1 Tax=Gymnopus androsaceus JB14 TaxID=1447944 RepID=A0A6A4HZ76_9AGAR|nr:hypothetical protein BT96DRAFT_991729 [Gymnopus androsaceus JB14]